jgi:hypothetical protein
MREEIRVVIGKDGEMTLSVEGVAGPRCLSLTEAFERDLGRVLGRHRKGAYYDSARVHHSQRTGHAFAGKESTEE